MSLIEQMKSSILTLFLLLSLASGSFAQALVPSFGSARAGTSGFQFIKIGVDPRAAAMGNSSVADAKDASSLYWNPALAVQMEKSQYMVSYISYFADINVGYMSYIHYLKKYQLSLGLSLQFLDSGNIDETSEFKPFGTGRTFKTVHYALGLTASQRLTELFSYGITLRYLDERIENVQMQTGTVDFGFFYKVGETGLRFAVGVTNFGFDASPSGNTTRQTIGGELEIKDFEAVSPPTSFSIGAAYDAWKNETMNLIVTAQLTKPSDNAEKTAVGAELGFLNQFFFRTGYEFGVEEILFPSAGFGVKRNVGAYTLDLDLSYTNYERLGNLPRFAMKVSF